MQISRIATIVAAGVITPALFLAAPATAADAPATAGQTTEQTTQTNQTTTGTTDAGKDKATQAFNPVRLSGIPKAFKAGADEWTVIHVTFDNKSGDKDEAFKPQALYVPAKAEAGKVEQYAPELEYQIHDATWPSPKLKPTQGTGDQQGRSSSLSTNLREYVVPKGDTVTFDLRLHFGKQVPAHDATFRVEQTGKPEFFGEQHFAIEAAKDDTAPTGNASPTATGRTTPTSGTSKSPTASTSPTATASASPTASASAGASASASSGSGWSSGGNSASGSGSNSASGQLAATGSDPATPWIGVAGAVAIAAGAGLVVATRRRRSAAAEQA
ncbi:LAETG motif-containing sortase-dependent surface protein [Streptomyces sp. NPDC049555]|uniref:LAETG motif-containing sortase-dependent surface protein n=1 Tax=Streptomyces sp. NPDC049555 TaxID=3154930 RepID=UPI003443A6C2